MDAKPTVYNQLMLEVTDFCDLDCRMCSRALTGTVQMHPGKKPGFISLDTVRNTLETVYNFWTTPLALKLFWCGEPLLHPEFEDILSMGNEFCKANNAYIDFHTNANLLASQLDTVFNFRRNIPRITFSIDALRETTYRKIRVGGNLRKVEAGIREFLQRRKLEAMQSPKIVVQFIVLDENNSECNDFIKYWTGVLLEYDTGGTDMDTIWIKKGDGFPPRAQKHHDRIFDSCTKKVKRDSHSFASERIRLVANESNQWDIEDRNAVKPDLHLHCGAPFTSPVVDSRGNLTCCCMDSALVLTAGNINCCSFSNLWFSEKYQQIRKAFLTGDTLHFPSICRDCPGYSGSLHSEFINEVYAI